MKAKDKKRKMSELRGSISEAVEDENVQMTDRMCEISDERAIELPGKTEQQFVDEADESKNGNSLEETGRQWKVKICGLRTPEEIEWANELKPDFVGFVFAPTKRQVTTGQAEKLRKLLDAKIPAVGVFVNEDEAAVAAYKEAGVKNPMTCTIPDNVTDQYIIKRVIAFPGERVVVKDGIMTIYNDEYPEGFIYDKLWRTSETDGPKTYTSGEVDMVVPNGEIFVSGDNREGANSWDSRNGLGTIPLCRVIGPVAFRLFPFDKIRTF